MDNVKSYESTRVGVEDELTLWGYFKRCFTEKYADFTGRARRKEYWGFTLWYSLLLALIQIPVLSSQNTGGGEFGVFDLIYVVFLLASILPVLSVQVRRLHDIGKSGWWYLITFIPVIGAIVLLVFNVRDSQPFANEYGESPKYGSV